MATWPPESWVDDERVTVAVLTTRVTDAFTALNAHTHDGSGGDGSANITPSSVLFTDQADLDAPASGKTVIWSNSGKLHQRTNGGAAQEFALVGHTHTLGADANAEDSDRHNAAAISGPTVDQIQNMSVDAVQVLSTTTITVADGARLITVGSAFCRSSIGSTVDLELLVDGNIRDTAAVPTTSGLTSMVLHAEEAFATGKSLTIQIRAVNNHASSTPDFQYGNSALAGRSVELA